MIWSYRFKHDQNKTSSNLTNRIHTTRHTLQLRYINTSVYRLSSSNTNDKWWPSSFLISEAAVVGRGCSTKDKVFYKECETHSYGEQVEKMCFCSYFLCNLSSVLAPPSCLLLMIIGATLCVLNSDYSACLISRTSLVAATPLINSSSHSGLEAHNTKPRWFF